MLQGKSCGQRQLPSASCCCSTLSFLPSAVSHTILASLCNSPKQWRPYTSPAGHEAAISDTHGDVQRHQRAIANRGVLGTLIREGNMKWSQIGRGFSVSGVKCHEWQGDFMPPSQWEKGTDRMRHWCHRSTSLLVFTIPFTAYHLTKCEASAICQFRAPDRKSYLPQRRDQ